MGCHVCFFRNLRMPVFSGYPLEALLLELQMLDSTTRVPGETLTAVEKRYRTQWVGALHAVMQNVSGAAMPCAVLEEGVSKWLARVTQMFCF